MGILEIINWTSLVSFTILMILGFSRILFRYIEYKRLKINVPTLLRRDLYFFGGLTLPFLGIFIFRFLGITPTDGSYLAWVLFSSICALFGVGNWVYYEFFIIEK